MVVGAGQHERDKMYFINDAEFGEGFISTLSPLALTSSLFQKPPKRNNLLCLHGPAATDKIDANQCNYALFFHIVSLRRSY